MRNPQLPKVDLEFATRISQKLVGVVPSRVLEVLSRWPADDIQHWVWIGAGAVRGEPLIMHQQNVKVPRFLFCVMSQHIVPPTWRVAKTCPVENCVHPWHHEPLPYRQNRYGYTDNLPAPFGSASGPKQQTSSEEIEELAEEFHHSEDDLSVTRLLAKYGATFSDSEIRRAVARAHELRK